MTRRARVVVENCPHHVTQRGNKRERIFFEAGDQQVYLDLMAGQLARHEISCWSYCLMPNHVHFILVPTKEEKGDLMRIKSSKKEVLDAFWCRLCLNQRAG